jgi:hypothetical protein
VTVFKSVGFALEDLAAAEAVFDAAAAACSRGVTPPTKEHPNKVPATDANVGRLALPRRKKAGDVHERQLTRAPLSREMTHDRFGN